MLDVTKNLKDAVYVLIGLGVISYQRAEARRTEARAQLNKLAKDVETRVEPIVTQARQAAKDAETTIRARFNTAAA